MHPHGAIEALKKRAGDASVAEEQRKKAIVALAFIKDKKAAEAMRALGHSNLKDVTDEASWWINFRKTNDWFVFFDQKDIKNISSAADLVIAKQMPALEKKLLDKQSSLQDKMKAAKQMAKDPVGGQLLISIASQKKLSKQLINTISGVIFQNPDRAVRTEAGDYFQRPGANKRFSIPSIIKLKPEAARGNAIFASSCASCHKAGSQGREFGPELTSIRKKFDRTSLLDAIINPSAGIVFGYEPWLVKTKDGRSFYGFLVADGETIVIKDIGGEQHAIKAALVQSKRKLKESVMPDPSALGLDEKKLADLAEFLLSLKEE
jgi:putative heme-binding domain-containing protein